MSDHRPSHPDTRERAAKAAARRTRAASATERRKRVERLAYPLVEAAEAIGRDPATLHRWIAKGLVHAIRIGGSTLITRAELDRLLTEGTPSRRGRQTRAAGGQFTKATAED